METNGKNGKNGKIWTKLTALQKRLALIVGIILAVSYLYPRVVAVIEYISGVIKFNNERPIYEERINMLVNYAKVDRGLSKAQMEKGDSIDRYVMIHINGKETEVKVDIRRQKSGDYKVFVPDGNVGVYGVYYNKSLENWEYYDFRNHHHITYTKK